MGSAGADAGTPGTIPLCDRCLTEMVNHHCRLVCPKCGLIRDCSDP